MKRESRLSEDEVFFRPDKDELLSTDEDVDLILELLIIEGERPDGEDTLLVTLLRLQRPLGSSTEDEVILLEEEAESDGDDGLMDGFLVKSALVLSDLDNNLDMGDDFNVSERFTEAGIFELTEGSDERLLSRLLLLFPGSESEGAIFLASAGVPFSFRFVAEDGCFSAMPPVLLLLGNAFEFTAVLVKVDLDLLAILSAGPAPSVRFLVEAIGVISLGFTIFDDFFETPTEASVDFSEDVDN